ncbi:MAG: aldo/keto reductase [Turicibacter sp.]|nr:aldo/keto reductase [Turicibacter sp.]
MNYKNVAGNEISVLGLGCMRFSRNAEETERLILGAIERGVNYFDTAYLYPGSEKILGGILRKNGKREGVFIATKLPLLLCKKRADFDKFFAEQLARLQTEYVDYYLMHNVSSYDHWRSFVDMGVEEWLADKVESGQIRKVGFSFHGASKEFLRVLESRKWDFCMIQYNYSDENFQAGKVGLQAAYERGVPVIVMEPLLGGRLATGLPREAIEVFRKVDNLSAAAWGLRWLWAQKEVACVLSGVGSEEIMSENIQTAENFSELTAEHLDAYKKVIKIFKSKYKIGCTGCNYCLPCPQGINIPSCFAAYNNRYVQGFMTGMAQYVLSTAAVTKMPISPRKCVDCKKCERECPQNLEIVALLKTVSRKMEPLPVRAVLAVARKVM